MTMNLIPTSTKGKIILSLSIVFLLFIIFFMGKCSSKSGSKTQTDTTSTYIKKIELSNKQYLEEIITLTKSKKQDSLDFFLNYSFLEDDLTSFQKVSHIHFPL